MGEGGPASFFGAPRSPEFRRLSQWERYTLDAIYSETKAFVVGVPIMYMITRRFGDPSLARYPAWVREKIILPAARRLRCRPVTVILGCISAVFWTNHVYRCRVAYVRAEYGQILKFIEQDKGLVKWVTMALIPVEKRWSYAHKHEILSPDFIADEQCQKEASTAIFDPALAYERPTEGFAEDESAWERVRRESEA